VRLELGRFLDDHFAPGEVSGRALAETLGVSDRTVRRWLAGEDRPEPAMQDAVAQWLLEMRAQL